jgi:hypothetical protein
MDTHPDSFVTLYIHRNDGYETPWGDARMPLYQVTGYPTPIYDGIRNPYYEGYMLGYPYPYTQYMPIALDEQLAIPTDVTIDVQLFGSGDSLHAQAVVCIEPGGTGKTMRLHMVRVLDHYPAGQVYHRNCVMEGYQIGDVQLAAGACTLVEGWFVLDAASLASPSDVGVVVFAQDTLSVWPSDVYQVGQSFGPPTGVFTDGLEDGTTAAWELTVP